MKKYTIHWFLCKSDFRYNEFCCSNECRYKEGLLYFVMCKVYTGYHGTREIEHGLWACTVDNPFAKARGLSLHTGAQTMLHLSPIEKPDF